MPPRLTGAKINNDETVAALVARVADISNAVTRGCAGGAEVEANVVEILK